MIEPVTIDPDAILDDGALLFTLGLRPAAMARARRSGLLRFTRQGRRILYKGAWILEWLDKEAEVPASSTRQGET
jgi:hypothetical protein